MEPVTLLIIGVVIVAVIIIIVKIAKAIFKFVLVVAAVLVGLFIWNNLSVEEVKEEGIEAVFKNKTISEMPELCATKETIKCKCIIEIVHADITERLSKREIRKTDKDPQAVMEQIQISLRNKKKEIKKCLLENEGQKLLNGVEKVIEKIKEKGQNGQTF